MKLFQLVMVLYREAPFHFLKCVVFIWALSVEGQRGWVGIRAWFRALFSTLTQFLACFFFGWGAGVRTLARMVCALDINRVISVNSPNSVSSFSAVRPSSLMVIFDPTEMIDNYQLKKTAKSSDLVK